jgi:hypothetical protein
MTPRVPHPAAPLGLAIVAILAAAVAVAACGGGKHAPANTGHNVGLVRWPCGIDPWKGAARHRCMALVSRWPPVHSLPLTTRLAPRVRSTCEQTQRESRMPVVCPPLIPTGGVVAFPALVEQRSNSGEWWRLATLL